MTLRDIRTSILAATGLWFALHMFNAVVAGVVARSMGVAS